MATRDPSPLSSDERPDVPNTVALIGVVLLGVAVALCILLFILVSQLPDGIREVQQLNSTGPAQLRLLILICATAVLTVVSFLLCAVGLFVRNRPRLLAAVGTGISLLMLMGIFGVLAVGTLMDSGTAATAPEAQSE